MTENEQKQQLSIAYVHAIASRSGYACQPVLVDDDSVDVVIGARGMVHDQAVLRSPRLEVQLKATAQDCVQADHVTFPLPIKNYDDLREPTMIPRLLVVLVLPPDSAQWLEHSEEGLVSRRCAYWLSITGQPPTENTASVTVKLPRSNQFSIDGLKDLMRRAARKELR